MECVGWQWLAESVDEFRSLVDEFYSVYKEA